MGGKPKDGGRVSKTNVSARVKAEKPRAVVLVYESYRKANGAVGLRSHFEDL